jgi:hypothetical protein
MSDASSPHVDVTVPATGGSVNLRSASGGMEAVWLRVLDEHDRRTSYDRATGEHVAAPVRLTPSEARHLADVLRLYADTHRESDS